VLLVELEPGGLIALHSTPEAAVCHVVEGSGTLFFENDEKIEFARGDTIEFAAGLVHGWTGGPERTLVAVTTYSVPG
jgi:quercetin dioxygenase-like cupin family protein